MMKNLTLKDKLIVGFVALLVLGMATLWLMPAGLRKAPDITLTLLDGSSLSLASLRGKPVIVTFWATTCPGCIAEIPHLIDLHNKLASRGLNIIGIAMPYDRPDRVTELVKLRGLPYRIALDIQGDAVRAFGNVQLTPTTFVIDPSGRIVKQKIGEMDMQQVYTQLLPMLPTQQAALTSAIKG